MSNIVGLDLNIDQEYIAESVQKIVKAAIVSALGDQDTIVRKAIDSTINSYVDENGKKVDKGSWRAIPYLDWIAEQTVKNTVQDCIKEFIEENKDEFKEVIKQQLSNKKFKDNIAGEFLKTMISAANNIWKMPITVSFKTNDE